MTRYRTPRRNSTAATPIVAFLLIACFGLLFVTGCSSETATEPTEDDTFTAEDVERFRELSREGESMSPGGTMESGTGGMLAMSSAPAEGTAASVAPVDPGLRKLYDAYRATASAQGGNAYRVTNPFLNVRSEPNVSAALVARLDQGALVTVGEFTNGTWAKITAPGGVQGYVTHRYLSKLTTEEKLKEEQKAFEGQYFVNFAFVNVRAAPETSSDKLGELPGQAFVKPLSIDRSWARIAFEGREGYVSTEYLSPFRPNFLVRQERFAFPILRVDAADDGAVAALPQHLARLKQSGVKFITLRDLFDAVQTQEVRDVRLPPKSAVLAITGLTAQTIKAVSDALAAAGVPATLFLQTDQIGLSGISEKTLLTLQANGADLQSAGHTGDDLRTLTDAQTQLELQQSRTLLEQVTRKTVFAVAYPQGGANDRVLNQAADAGYLFGVGTAPDGSFTRDQFLRLPSYAITAGMSADDVAALVK